MAHALQRRNVKFLKLNFGHGPLLTKAAIIFLTKTFGHGSGLLKANGKSLKSTGAVRYAIGCNYNSGTNRMPH